ncbi:MAG: hypothetical protein M3076_16035 [Actinomycetota bacterium]|nr:hypothetical protein [Actinomycetota bacterium]
MSPAAGVMCVLVACAGCGSSHHSGPSKATVTSARTLATTSRTTTRSTAAPRSVARSHRLDLIAILPGARRHGLFGWTPAVAVRGHPAVWIARVQAYHESGFTVTLLRFDQRLVKLALHAGRSQPGGAGWRYGDSIAGAERRLVVTAFNSAFEESYGAGGFEQGGRIGWPLRRGLASVVIYRDGFADIGRWRQTVPTGGRAVEAVRQNLGLLISAGRIASTVDTCIKVCWGDPLHEQPIVARSGLGIASGGDLVWAAGHNLSVRALAEALAAKGVVRAIELDINPRWVAGYLYAHPRRRHTLVPIPVVAGQTGIPGQFMVPYFRDFFTILTRPA